MPLKKTEVCISLSEENVGGACTYMGARTTLTQSLLTLQKNVPPPHNSNLSPLVKVLMVIRLPIYHLVIGKK